MRRLLIISSSKKVQKDPSHPIPALNRLGGNSAKVLRKFCKKSKQSQPLDVLMLSPVYGLVMAEQKIDFIEPIGGEWDKMALSNGEILKLRETNLSTFQKLLAKQHYDEIYVNLYGERGSSRRRVISPN